MNILWLLKTLKSSNSTFQHDQAKFENIQRPFNLKIGRLTDRTLHKVLLSHIHFKNTKISSKLLSFLRSLDMIDRIWCTVSKVIVKPHPQFNLPIVSYQDLRRRQPSKLHLCQIVKHLQVDYHLLEYLTNNWLRKSQDDLKQVKKRTFLKIIYQDRYCPFWIIVRDRMHLNKRKRCSFPHQLLLPKIDPILNRIPWLSSTSWLLPDAHQFKRRDMKHLLDSSCIVSSLDNIKSDAFADLVERTIRFFKRNRFAFPDRVDSLGILKFLISFFLHFQISFISSQRISINRLISILLRSLLLPSTMHTKLMGLRYFFTCSYYRSLTNLSY